MRRLDASAARSSLGPCDNKTLEDESGFIQTVIALGHQSHGKKTIPSVQPKGWSALIRLPKLGPYFKLMAVLPEHSAPERTS